MKNENQSIQPITTESQSVQFIFPNALVRTKNKSGKLSIRECFKDARKTLMLSRQTVGKNWGVSRKIILHYENGYRNIPVDILMDIFCAGIKSLTESSAQKAH